MNDYYTSCNMHKTYSLLLVVNQGSKIKCRWNGSGIRGLAGTVVNWRALRKWGCRCSAPTRYSCARLLWPDLQNVQEELEIQMFICNYWIVKRQQCVHIFFLKYRQQFYGLSKKYLWHPFTTFLFGRSVLAFSYYFPVNLHLFWCI